MMLPLIVVSLLATSVLAQYSVRSADFVLVLVSDNSTINGTTLGACHEGAATEGLCLYAPLGDDSNTYYTFYHNVSEGTSANETAYDAPGILGYDLEYGENLTVPSSTDLKYEPTTNIAVPIIAPGEDGSGPYTLFAFDACGFLYFEGGYEDTTDPIDPETSLKLENWFVCETYYGYPYTTLAWVVGKYPAPQNPTCVQTQVKRVFFI